MLYASKYCDTLNNFRFEEIKQEKRIHRHTFSLLFLSTSYHIFISYKSELFSGVISFHSDGLLLEFPEKASLLEKNISKDTFCRM
jgi:hypothetical protein